ncbi:MAG: hypothetical protein CM15mP83_0130 [Flavobacteriaceae bacterium]|nr:MAG: hypothetical protein CM15mP83_0130 [Flavobacteriaceae bacterium]
MTKTICISVSISGYENVKTKFGVVPCVKFRPYVEEGRIFKKRVDCRFG